jgi:hypothetical protein
LKAKAQSIFVPAVTTSLFALGVEKKILAGHLAYVVITAWAILYNVFLRMNASKLRTE